VHTFPLIYTQEFTLHSPQLNPNVTTPGAETINPPNRFQTQHCKVCTPRIPAPSTSPVSTHTPISTRVLPLSRTTRYLISRKIKKAGSTPWIPKIRWQPEPRKTPSPRLVGLPRRRSCLVGRMYHARAMTPFSQRRS